MILIQNPQAKRMCPRIGKVEYDGVNEGLFAANNKTGKPARTLCRVLHRCLKTNSTLVELVLYTGRPHQIRIHLASIGHPLVGDPLYVNGGIPLVRQTQSPSTRINDGENRGDRGVLPGDCGYELHALSMRFQHPITLQPMFLLASPPPSLCLPNEFQDYADRL